MEKELKAWIDEDFIRRDWLERVGPEDIDFGKLKDIWGESIIPAVVVDFRVWPSFLMVGFMNREALELTAQRKEVVFWSRSRKELWYKGKTSGNRLVVREFWLDCDNDTLVLEVRSPDGPICHIGRSSCFRKVVLENRKIDFRELRSGEFGATETTFLEEGSL